MSVISTVQHGLRTISNWFAGPEADGPNAPTVPLTEASRVVDEAILDPTMRMMLEQQQKPSRETLETVREIFSSPERFKDFKEREKALLMRLGASEELVDALFHGLFQNGTTVPMEALAGQSPEEVYHTLEKLRLALASALLPPLPSVPPDPRGERRGKLIAGAIHTTCGIGLIAGNFSGLVVLLFTAPLIAPVTFGSKGLGAAALKQAYNRFTEVMRLGPN